MSLTRLKLLRQQLTTLNLTGFIVPRQDEFQGEYVPAYAERLKWLTGFAGSWGLAIVLAKKAAIFVDGRYTSQVREQVDVKIFAPQHLIDAPPADWLVANLKKDDRMGFDPALTTIADARRFAAACQKAGAKLVPVARNPIDAIWADQPARPQNPVTAQPQEFAGRSAKDKLADLAKMLATKKLAAVVITEPSSVSWLFNIRGNDVPFTPVVLAHAVVKAKGKADLFIEEATLAADVKAQLKPVARLHDPANLQAVLKALAKIKAIVMVDPSSASEQIGLSLNGAKLVEGQDPCALPKAQKNAVEQQGARDAQHRDGIALTRFLHWLSEEAPKGELDEASAAARLLEFRQQSNLLKDLSFETISASGPNAAIPHYHLDLANPRSIGLNEIFLIDSGGQYQDGTTDVTRTIIVGDPSPQMKDRFTRVLKGMIALSMLRFPEGTTGAHIDALARASLWSAGLDFDHGTGHGIGSYLSVHEGPQRISKAGHVALKPGMILSNEPGYYKPGAYGIRIENLLIVKEPETVEGGDRPMLSFETITLAPIDRNLIETALLVPAEQQWLDRYHARVLAELGPQVDEDAKAWLIMACAPLA